MTVPWGYLQPLSGVFDTPAVPAQCCPLSLQLRVWQSATNQPLLYPLLYHHIHDHSGASRSFTRKESCPTVVRRCSRSMYCPNTDQLHVHDLYRTVGASFTHQTFFEQDFLLASV